MQREIAQSVCDNQETAVRSCHGPGKSFLGSRLALWFLYAHKPSLVITTAPTDRQVRGILWKEIRNGHRLARMPLAGTVLQQELKLDDNWFAWGFTAPEFDPDRFQGFHEVHILVIVDESAGVSDLIFDAIDGILTSEQARLLMIGNPTSASGRFYEAFRTPGIEKFKISAFDTPNFTEFGITREDIVANTWQEKITGDLPRPYLVTPAWVRKRYERWGLGSALWDARVEGDFPKAGIDTLIPLQYIETAQARTAQPGIPVCLAADIARYGEDETVIMHRQGPVVRTLEVLPMCSTMEAAGHIKRQLIDTGAPCAKIDAIGIGAGTYDRLVEQQQPAIEVNSSARSSEPERYLNARAEWYWKLREIFERGDIDIDPDDDILASQLASLKYRINSAGQIMIESKEDMKKRGISSPDRADTLAIAMADSAGAGMKIPLMGFGGMVEEEDQWH